MYGVGNRQLGFETVESDDGNFDYHEKVLVEDSQVRFRDFWSRPIGGVSNQSGPFIFVIEPFQDQYIQLNNTRLEAVVSLVNANGNPVRGFVDIVAPVNLLGAVMWENVEVQLNGHPLSGASSINTGYKAYLETMLSYDTDARKTHLQCQFSHIDSPGQYGNMNIHQDLLKTQYLKGIARGLIEPPPIPAASRDLPPNPINAATGQPLTPEEISRETARRDREQQTIYEQHFDEIFGHAAQGDALLAREATIGRRPNRSEPRNYGFEERFSIATDSEPFTMVSPICHDFFSLNNHIAPLNKIDIKLTMHSPRFLINTYFHHNGYKLKLHDLKLHLRNITRRERIRPPLKETYRMNETQMLKQVVPGNLTNYTFRIFNSGVLPKTVVLAMVPTMAAEGAYNYNPFNFHHFHVTKMALKINGEEYPSTGLKTDFQRVNQDCIYAYHWMYANSGALASDRGNMVSLPAFKAGAFIVPIDLTPDKCNGLHNHNAETGWIDVELSFARPLPYSITVLYMLTFNKVLVNDKSTGTVAVVDVAV